VIRDEMGLSLEKAGKEVLGTAKRVLVTKDSTLIVTNGFTQKAVDERVSQIKNLIENTEENFQKKILNERVARLSGGIAIIQVTF
jgi:chaperonin GroEL